MIFTPGTLSGVWIVEPTPLHDARGFFARSFCADEFAARGLEPAVAQCNISYNERTGTLRGLHGSQPEHPEAKLVRCTAGAMWDVVIDARPNSSTIGRWEAFELTAANRRAVYIPPGFLHGFLTLAHATEVFYQMAAPFRPAVAFGAHWQDPELAIAWPAAPQVVSDRDNELPPFRSLLQGRM